MTRLIFILIISLTSTICSQAQTIQYIGAPTTTVISRGNFRTDSIFYLPKRSKAPTDTAAFRYQISDSSLYVWTGSQWIKAGGSGTISGTGITGYIPQFNGTTTIDTSALFTLGSRLGIGTSSFAYTSATSSIELNGTAGGILGFKRNDSARGYLWHTGDNMELANTTAGAISFNTNSATRGSISSAGVWRLHNLAGTGDRVVVASSNGTLSASTSVTGLVDTTTISTRAWRQKGDDSLGAIIATKGSGTVTSVATGFGLSGGTITTTGTLLVDTLNIATRAWRQKGLDSLAALEVSGSGTTNYIPKFTAASTIGNSLIYDNGSTIGIGSTAGTYYFEAKRNGTADIVANSSADNNSAVLSVFNSGGTSGNFAQLRAYGNTTASTLFGSSTNKMISLFSNGDALMTMGTISATPLVFGTTNAERMRIFANGRIGVNTTTDAGYQFDINGTLRSVNGANFATTSGNVGIGTASPGAGIKLDVVGIGRFSSYVSLNDQGYIRGGTNTLDLQSGTTGTYFYNSGYNAVRMAILDGGNVGIGTTSPTNAKLVVEGSSAGTIGAIMSTDAAGTTSFVRMVGDVGSQNLLNWQTGTALRFATSTQAYGTFAEHARINSNGEFLINTTTDAGDYKLQVSGNALVTAGKLDISSNTTFSMNVQRSGTSAVAGTFNNSNGILYLGAESSTGGSLFTGSSAYAAVIGSGAAYPLQFATNNVVRASINADGEMLIGGSDVGLYNLQVTGNAYTQTFQYVGSVLGINTGTYNSAGTAQITMKNGTNPDGSVTDQFILYSADVVAGNAAPHFRTENGGIIKLYQETTAVGAATFTANSGTTVNDASTFDGYTLKQIVKALRNQGILQ